MNVNEAPTITSAATATYLEGTAGNFTVTSIGFPAPSFTKTGTLPSGITLNASTGALAGTPAANSFGNYPIIITANNGFGSEATQDFTLSVHQTLAITSAASTRFAVSTPGDFTVTTVGFPVGSLIQSGTLPSGVTFDTGSGVLSGTPDTGSQGTYVLGLTFSNGVLPDATQTFTLFIGVAAAITSGNNDTFTVGAADDFTVTVSGDPAPTLSVTGTLPTGVTFDVADRRPRRHAGSGDGRQL